MFHVARNTKDIATDSGDRRQGAIKIVMQKKRVEGAHHIAFYRQGAVCQSFSQEQEKCQNTLWKKSLVDDEKIP